MDLVSYNRILYPIRTLVMEHESLDGNVSRNIAPESLIDAIQAKEGDDYLDEGNEGHSIDSMIYHYVEDKYFYLSGEEICKKHLDMPFTFVEEV